MKNLLKSGLMIFVFLLFSVSVMGALQTIDGVAVLDSGTNTCWYDNLQTPNDFATQSGIAPGLSNTPHCIGWHMATEAEFTNALRTYTTAEIITSFSPYTPPLLEGYEAYKILGWVNTSPGFGQHLAYGIDSNNNWVDSLTFEDAEGKLHVWITASYNSGQQEDPVVPEFSTVGIILTIVVVGLATALILKRKSK